MANSADHLAENNVAPKVRSRPVSGRENHRRNDPCLRPGPGHWAFLFQTSRPQDAEGPREGGERKRRQENNAEIDGKFRGRFTHRLGFGYL